MWITGFRLVGRVGPSTRSSCFRSSSSGRHRVRSPIKSSTPSMGTRRPSAASSSCGTVPGTGSKRHSDGTFVVLPPWTPRPRMRLRRKTSESQLQDAHEPAETCDARCPGREDVYHEFDCASALKEVQLVPTESAHGFGDTVSCPFCPVAAAGERQAVSVHVSGAPPRARKAFRLQWHQAAARRDGPSSV